MIYMRGQARDYDGWAGSTGDPGWGWDDVPALLSRGTRTSTRSSRDAFDAGTRAAASGASRSSALRWEILDAFAHAAVAGRHPATDDFNRGDNEGVGYFDVNQRAGMRWNATKAFLRPVLHGAEPAGLDRRARRARRCSTAGGVTGAASCASGGGEPASLPARARRGGARGRRDRLAADPAAVGHRPRRPCCDRTASRCGTRCPASARTCRTTCRSAASTVRGREDAEHAGQHALGQGADRAAVRADAQRADEHGAVAARRVRKPIPAARAQPRVPRPAAVARRLRRAAASVQGVHGQRLQPQPDEPRRGAHHARRTRRMRRPLRPNYLATDEDRHVAAESLRLTRRIVAQPALAKFQPRRSSPGLEFETDDELARLAGDIGTTIFHPVGTCKMGPATTRRRGRRPPARARRRRPARRRRQQSCPPSRRQHQLADADDRREGRRDDLGRWARTRSDATAKCHGRASPDLPPVRSCLSVSRPLSKGMGPLELLGQMPSQHCPRAHSLRSNSSWMDFEL